ncbi:secondary thiamine-phosphate synthase enzyme YjbQ [Pisciglobus halotolerans]|uniref:Secondary thiamine-phosphate synthase enzyme n=1 Tax=Pisciglobus halotolerans TaxID=745365 RepID=A0A1I3CK44_9LACT|nr:secondary thiamine-phosphate synthase enzyme YjbQ [Pisciglobus halotolerans]SFH74934.1 secondary thiamine-phosphate synthase enzyme [Pisciglobus halotolerans]
MKPFLKKIEMETKEKQSLTNIDHFVEEAVTESGIEDGIVLIFCPHTTAAITINENADLDVQRDLDLAYRETFPNRAAFVHQEGNSDGHLKSSVTGTSEMVILTNGKILFGTWQSLYFWDFDGPRNRHFFVKIVEG